jgi:hypothetical protein
MIFVAFVTFLARPKEGVSRALLDLTCLGVSVKLIHGKLVTPFLIRPRR